jgi:hypothetical protein
MRIGGADDYRAEMRAHQQQITNLLYRAWQKGEPAFIRNMLLEIGGMPEALTGYEQLERLAHKYEPL